MHHWPPDDAGGVVYGVGFVIGVMVVVGGGGGEEFAAALINGVFGLLPEFVGLMMGTVVSN